MRRHPFKKNDPFPLTILIIKLLKPKIYDTMPRINDNCHCCITNNNQRRVGWAKFYTELEERIDGAPTIISVAVAMRESNMPTLPPHIMAQYMEMAMELKKELCCPICLEMVTKENYQYTYCGHIYCKDCLDKIKTTKTCAVCRIKIN